MGDHFLIDGFNFIHGAIPEAATTLSRHASRGSGMPRRGQAASADLRQSVETVLRDLETFAALSGHTVTIVFDGGRFKDTFSSSPMMEILFSKAGETADAVLERFMARIDPPRRLQSILVSQDRALRDMAVGFGCRTREPAAVWEEVRRALRDAGRAYPQSGRRKGTEVSQRPFNAPFRHFSSGESSS